MNKYSSCNSVVARLSSAFLLSLISSASYAQGIPEQTGADVLGIRLGMSIDDAYPIVKGYANFIRKPLRLASLQITRDAPGEINSVPVENGKFMATMYAGNTHMDTHGSDGDNDLAVAFTPAPNNEKVAGVYRKLGFDSKSRPLESKLLNELKSKYGEPTADYFDEFGKPSLAWAYDSEGKLLSSWKGKACQISFPRPNPNLTHPTGPAVSWNNVIVGNWRGSVEQYLSSCGAKQLIVRRATYKELGLVYRMDVLFYDIKGVLTAQKGVTDLIARSKANADANTISNARNVRTPAL